MPSAPGARSFTRAIASSAPLRSRHSTEAVTEHSIMTKGGCRPATPTRRRSSSQAHSSKPRTGELAIGSSAPSPTRANTSRWPDR